MSKPLQFPDLVATQVQYLQLGYCSEVLNDSNHVIVHKQTLQVGQWFKSLNFLDEVVLKVESSQVFVSL
mgnify:FL=1